MLVIFLVILPILASIFIRRKATFNKFLLNIRKDFSIGFLLIMALFVLFSFTVYPDVVWDYYLTGLPVIFFSILALYLAHLVKNKALKLPVYLLILFLLIINFDKNVTQPVKITWLGDGATYRNPKAALDYIAQQNPKDYSFYSFSPSIFDYPFEYLIYWYSREGLLEKPQENQKLAYLIIREASSRSYLSTGWYGDKTKDKTTILESKEFPGDLIVEKHYRND